MPAAAEPAPYPAGRRDPVTTGVVRLAKLGAAAAGATSVPKVEDAPGIAEMPGAAVAAVFNPAACKAGVAVIAFAVGTNAVLAGALASAAGAVTAGAKAAPRPPAAPPSKAPVKALLRMLPSPVMPLYRAPAPAPRRAPPAKPAATPDNPNTAAPVAEATTAIVFSFQHRLGFVYQHVF